MNRYYKKIKKKNKYSEFIRVLNGILNLTPREGYILSLLFTIQESKSANELKRDGLITKEVRGYIKETENMSKSGLSKIEHSLKDRGVLISNTKGKLIINPIFNPIETEKGLKVMFILDYKTIEDEIII